MITLQLAAAPFDDMGDELLVDFALKRFQPRHILFRFRPEWVEDRLVLASRIDPPVNAETFDGAVKAKTG